MSRSAEKARTSSAPQYLSMENSSSYTIRSRQSSKKRVPQERRKGADGKVGVRAGNQRTPVRAGGGHQRRSQRSIHGCRKKSWRYGFILRYPPDKTALTAIFGEEWHAVMSAWMRRKRCMKRVCAWRSIRSNTDRNNQESSNTPEPPFETPGCHSTYIFLNRRHSRRIPPAVQRGILPARGLRRKQTRHHTGPASRCRRSPPPSVA